MKIKMMATAIAVVMFGYVVSATEYTWVGGTSGNWNTLANWKVGEDAATAVPKGGDTAIFNAAAEVSGDIAIGDAGTLTINRNFTFNGADEASALQLKGVISGDSITLTGDGAVRIFSDNTFTGTFTVSGASKGYSGAVPQSGTVFVYAPSALGCGTTYFDGTTGVRLYITNSITHITTPLYFKSSGNNDSCYIDLPNVDDFTFDENVYASAKCYLDGKKNVHFAKDIDVLNFFFGNNSQTIYVRGRFCPKGQVFFSFSPKALHLYSPGQKANNFNISFPVYAHCTNAVPSKGGYGTSDYKLGFSGNGGIYHLNGYDQELTDYNYIDKNDHLKGVIYQSSSISDHGYESEKPAMVTMAFVNKTAGEPITQSWWGKFYGKAGFCWNPVDSGSTFTFTTTIQPTSGELHVSNGVVKVTSGAGLPNLSKLVVGPNGTIEFDASATDTIVDELIINEGATVKIALGYTLKTRHAKYITSTGSVAELNEADYDSESGYFTGDGTLKVNDKPMRMNTWIWTGAAADYFIASHWSNGKVPSGDEIAVIPSGRQAYLTSSITEWPYELRIEEGGAMHVTGWNTVLGATNMVIAGTITLKERSYQLAQSNRVNIACGTLTIENTGKIDLDKFGWEAGAGLGARSPVGNTSGIRAGGAHGGFGSLGLLGGDGDYSYVHFGCPYDDPYAPVYQGSCGGVNGLAGGGAVKIVATGKVTVNGKILASAESAGGLYKDFQAVTCGSGGSVWIKCSSFEGSSGVIRADGGDGDMGCFPTWYAKLLYGTYSGYEIKCGGGGMIRIEYTDSAAQQAAKVENMVVSAAAGRSIGRLDGLGALTLATSDKFRTEADLGTVTFTDTVLVDKLLGKGLTGRLISSDLNTYIVDGNLNWTNGHVRFATEGAKFQVNGNLTISGYGSRVEVGGIETRTNEWVTVDRFGGSKLNSLIVSGNLTVTDGAALDIRAAETNKTNKLDWGGEVKVGGNMTVGNDAYVYSWCDIGTLGASHFEIGGNLDVQTGGTISADWRGGRGSWGSMANAKSYFNRYGSTPPGVGAAGSECGASYGGKGGHACSFAINQEGIITAAKTNGAPKAAFKDPYHPVFPGFGTDTGGYIVGNAGAGLVYIQAKGAITLNGLITADAQPMIQSSSGSNSSLSGYQMSGGGSGGGIYLEGESFGGAGRISARGGNATVYKVTGTGDYAGQTLYHCGGGGGGGCVAIAVGAACKAGRYNTNYAATRADNPIVTSKCTYTGTFELYGGTNCWSSTDNWALSTPAQQFDAAQGEFGTVRYIGFEPKPGVVILFR